MLKNRNIPACAVPAVVLLVSLVVGSVLFAQRGASQRDMSRSDEMALRQIFWGGGIYGACCFSTETARGVTGVLCQDEITQDECESGGGAYQGDGTDCSIIMCPEPELTGACCFDFTEPKLNGRGSSCQVLTENDCQLGGGVYQGNNSSCDVVDCTFGACCLFVDGVSTCEDTTVGVCSDQGGEFQGADIDCASVDCSYGACCFPEFDPTLDVGTSCEDLFVSDCESAGGIFQGDGILCDDVDCDEGACCFDDGGCSNLEPPLCDKLGGDFQGLDTNCKSDPCVVALPDRVDHTSKGSLLVFSMVDIRWDAAGFLIQDNFLSIANDFPDDVDVQLYFVNGDPPLDADPVTGERAHPGWNKVDNQIELTSNEPAYWSAVTGQPKGLAPFAEALDPGFPPGRPCPDGSGDRCMRGFVYAWAVNSAGEQIRWNHLVGSSVTVNYRDNAASECPAWSFRVLPGAAAHGQPVGTPGVLLLNGVEYVFAFDQLIMNFITSGSAALSGPSQVTARTEVTLHPVSADLRQETDGPVTTKAHYDVWNENEIKFSEAYRCITCWDATLLSQYGIPNNFTMAVLGTDAAKARIDGLQSQLCDVDFDPNNNADFPFPPQAGDPEDDRDVISEAAALLGVAVKQLTFDGGAMFDMAAQNIKGMGFEEATVLYDVIQAPPELENDPDGLDPEIERLLQE